MKLTLATRSHALGTTDSKQLKESERDDLFDVIKANNDFIGWNVRVLTPQDISGGMLRRCVVLS